MNLYIDDKKASIKDVLARLNIKENQIPKSKLRCFERLGVRNNDGLLKKDIQSGKAIMPAGYGIKCSFNALDKDGENVKITFAENAKTVTEKGGGTRIKYNPVTLLLPRAELNISADENVKHVFLSIHPEHAGSPLNIGKSNPKVAFRFKDTNARAKEENAKEDAFVEASVILRELSKDSRRTLAKGYSEPNIDEMEDDEVLSILRRKLKQDPEQFMLDINNKQVAFNGVIQNAFDKSIITHKDNGNQRVYYIADKEFARGLSSLGDVNNVKDVVLSDPDYYMPLILNGVKDAVNDSKLKNPAMNKYMDGFGAKSTSDSIIEEEKDVKLISDADRDKILQQEDREKKVLSWNALDLSDPAIHHTTRKAIILSHENGEMKRICDKNGIEYKPLKEVAA